MPDQYQIPKAATPAAPPSEQRDSGFFSRLKEFYSARRLRKHGFAAKNSHDTDISGASISEREDLYNRQEASYVMGLDVVRSKDGLFPCLKLGCTSFFSGVLFAGFFAGPLGCAYHTATAPPHLISVQHVLKAGSNSSLRWAMRYGIFLGSFRLLSCCLYESGWVFDGEEKTPESMSAIAAIAGAVAASSAPGFGSARFIPRIHPLGTIVLASTGCASLVYALASTTVEMENSGDDSLQGHYSSTTKGIR
eukprot:g203.t1